MKTTLTLLAAFTTVSANAMILDNFSVPYARTINSGSWVDYQTDADIYTGERDVALKILGTEGAAHYTIGEGKITLATEGAERTFAYLEYDGVGDEVGNIGPGHDLIRNPRSDLHFPEGTRLVRFHVQSVSTPRIYVLGARLFQNGTEMFSVFRNPSEAGIVDIPFAPSAFSICNTIELRVGLIDPNSSVVINKVELVPEPGSGLFYATGAALVGFGRRRKSRG